MLFNSFYLKLNAPEVQEDSGPEKLSNHQCLPVSFPVPVQFSNYILDNDLFRMIDRQFIINLFKPL